METTGILALLFIVVLLASIFVIGLNDIIIAFLLQKVLEPSIRWIQRVFFGIDRVRTGDEALIGSRAIAGRFDATGERGFIGSVVVDGERWSASSASPVKKGNSVSIIDRNDLLLVVEPLEDD